jgi:hypothetical protein
MWADIEARLTDEFRRRTSLATAAVATVKFIAVLVLTVVALFLAILVGDAALAALIVLFSAGNYAVWLIAIGAVAMVLLYRRIRPQRS